jgi:hypothetical protein
MLKTSLAVAAFAALMLAAGNAGAVQSKCLAGKINCVAKKANSLLVCHQKAETPNKPADPNFNGCLDKAMTAFDGGATPEKGCFEKLENKPTQDCITLDDTVDMEALVDQCVADIVAAIDPGPIDQTKCGVAKKKCAAKKLAALLKCHKAAATPNKPMDPNTNGCLDKAKEKFDGGNPEKGCFVKAETKSNNDCQAPLGNQALVETIVDDCVDAILAAIQSPPTTTTTGPTVTTTTTTSSTTTTTIGGAVACGANGLNVTYALQYPEPVVGGISAIKLRDHYDDPPVAIPGSANALSVRQRVTSLLPPGYTLQVTAAPFGDHDSNDPDAVEDTLEVRALATIGNSIRPGDAFRTRFDCTGGPGTLISPSLFDCSFLEPGGLDGQPLPSELAALITCNLTLTTAP